VADLVVVKVAERVECLAHDRGCLRLSQMFALRNVVEEFAALAEPLIKKLGIFRHLGEKLTYSVTRKQMRSVSHVSCNLMMLGWSYSKAVTFGVWFLLLSA
jgi:hypothetical protein